MNFANMGNQQQKKTKEISTYSLHQLGLSLENFTFVENIEDLKKKPPLIVIYEEMLSSSKLFCKPNQRIIWLNKPAL